MTLFWCKIRFKIDFNYIDYQVQLQVKKKKTHQWKKMSEEALVFTLPELNLLSGVL